MSSLDDSETFFASGKINFQEENLITNVRSLQPHNSSLIVRSAVKVSIEANLNE